MKHANNSKNYKKSQFASNQVKGYRHKDIRRIENYVSDIQFLIKQALRRRQAL